MEYITLSNGLKMPMLGFGVWKVRGEECYNSVLMALKAGYRLIDTAQIYLNEKEVGQALHDSGVPREEIFLTTKVWITNYGYENAIVSIKKSLKDLQTDYLDLVLIHQNYGDVYSTWRALEDLYDQGIIKAIGISNFYTDRMIDFIGFNRIAPMVNQVEINLFHQRKELRKYAEKYNVAVQGYMPLGHGDASILENEKVIELAKKYCKTPAQIMLRWQIQENILVIPKSVHEERIISNINVFDFCLCDEELASLDELDEQRPTGFWHRDPETVEYFVQRGHTKI